MNREEALERLEEVEYLLKEVNHCQTVIAKRRYRTGILFIVMWTICLLSLFYLALLPLLDMLWASLDVPFFHAMDIALRSYPIVTFTVIILPTIYHGLKISRANEAAVRTAQESIDAHAKRAADLIPLPAELQRPEEIPALKDHLYLEHADTVEEAIRMRMNALRLQSSQEAIENPQPSILQQPLPLKQKK